MKDLTLCIAVYNMDQYLDRCLSSLIMSDDRLMQRLEVLVINDGSTDGSAKVAQRYVEQWPQTFRLINKTNGQYGSCVNRALLEASGRYFRMLDADDWMNTEALAQMMQQLHDGEVADLVVTKFTRHSPMGEITHRNDPVQLEYGKVYGIDELVTFSREIWPSSYVMHNMTYRLELLRHMKLHLNEGIYYTDTQYCFYPLYHIQSAVFLDLDLYQYDVCREGQTTQLQVAYNHRHQLRLLVTQCVSYYLDQRDCHTPEFNQMARLLLMFLIKAFYMATCLGHRVSDGGKDREMLQDVDQLLQQDWALYAITVERKYNMLPYVQMVRRTGCWPYMGIYGLYNRTIDLIKRIVCHKDRHYE